MVWLAGLGIILAVVLMFVMAGSLYTSTAAVTMNGATALISALLVILLLVCIAVIGFSVSPLSVLFCSISHCNSSVGNAGEICFQTGQSDRDEEKSSGLSNLRSLETKFHIEHSIKNLFVYETFRA